MFVLLAQLQIYLVGWNRLFAPLGNLALSWHVSTAGWKIGRISLCNLFCHSLEQCIVLPEVSLLRNTV